MRERLILMAVLAAAAAIAALLVFPARSQHADDSSAPSVDSAPIPTPSVPVPVPASASAAPPTPPPPPPPPSYVHIDPDSPTACGDSMVLVDGIYCPFVGHSCTSFLDEEHDVCARYAPDVLCEGRLEKRRFCIDVFEYPNLAGVVPVVMVDFNDAKRACAVEGKRLCTVQEWEFACEGTQMWPYPYGIDRDATACNIDRPYRTPDLPAFSDPWKISAEIDKLDQRVPSGALARCVSPFGVHDMTGNVDEWVDNPDGTPREHPFRSTLKGGYWGPIRARCRPVTSTHNEWFSFYQVGFRCCRDPAGATATRQPVPSSVRVPQRQRMPPP